MMGVLKHLSALLLFSSLHSALSEVVVKFDPKCKEFFLDEKTPNIPGILLDGTAQNHYKPICQLFNNIYRYATLYDTTNRIPVFSAYTFIGTGGDSIKRPAWKIEPQLDEDKDPNMALATPGINYPNQAVKEDYVGAEDTHKVNRGHMFPNEHARDTESKNSTFTLTNCVPQAVTSNAFSWCNMEKSVKKILENNCKDANDKIKAYVVTGAVPSNDHTLKNRVNIPSHLWSAYCCYNRNLDKWMAKAYWSENVAEVCGKKRLKPLALPDLYEKLNVIYPGGEVSVFPQQCSSDFQLRLAGEYLDSDGKDRGRDGYGQEEDDECACPSGKTVKQVDN
ncbi:endonuclease domain-containing 1 protein [Oncorhynchus tshawytscha]|uniref:Endonuclease domain-containing 1 protein n=1 Tax=Oncorhynchus tshawytscha TaxID=74940 RepID=A0AAZ3Q0Q7_ONCTS|nr:endonuclease domain-containing 1 protein [Oncorhynchus tshawytscha]